MTRKFYLALLHFTVACLLAENCNAQGDEAEQVNELQKALIGNIWAVDFDNGVQYTDMIFHKGGRWEAKEGKLNHKGEWKVVASEIQVTHSTSQRRERIIAEKSTIRLIHNSHKVKNARATVKLIRPIQVPAIEPKIADAKTSKKETELDTIRLVPDLSRKWKDKSGKFSVEAKLIKVTDSVVSLLRISDQKIIMVPAEHLSKADKDHALKFRFRELKETSFTKLIDDTAFDTIALREQVASKIEYRNEAIKPELDSLDELLRVANWDTTAGKISGKVSRLFLNLEDEFDNQVILELRKDSDEEVFVGWTQLNNNDRRRIEKFVNHLYMLGLVAHWRQWQKDLAKNNHELPFDERIRLNLALGIEGIKGVESGFHQKMALEIGKSGAIEFNEARQRKLDIQNKAILKKQQDFFRKKNKPELVIHLLMLKYMLDLCSEIQKGGEEV